MAPTEPPGLPRRQVPFGGHQLAEYTLAAALVAVGIHLSGRPALVLMVGGGLVGALSLMTKAPLAAARLVPKRLHLVLDLVLAAAFALSPLSYLHNLQVIPTILSEAVALLLVRMSLTTEIVPRPKPEWGTSPSRATRLGALVSSSRPFKGTDEPSSRPSSEDRPSATERPGAAERPGATASSDAAAAVAATAGRVVGTAVARARSSGAPTAAARGLGRATGQARRIGRAAWAARSAPAASDPGPVPPGPARSPD